MASIGYTETYSVQCNKNSVTIRLEYVYGLRVTLNGY